MKEGKKEKYIYLVHHKHCRLNDKKFIRKKNNINTIKICIQFQIIKRENKVF